MSRHQVKSFSWKVEVNMLQADPQDWLWQANDVHGVT